MNEKADELDSEILDNIKPFSGERKELEAQTEMLMEGYALQKVQAAYTTAITVQQPRSLTKVTANVLEEADLAGEDFYYGWHVKTKEGKRWIEGGSIGLANCVGRNYGNCATDIIPMNETPTHFMLKGYFVDLESGFNAGRLFRQRKSQSMGMGDKDRQEDIVFQIAQSKAIRNVVLNAMPRWLITKAIERAKGAVRKGIGGNIKIARASVLEYFVNQGALQDRIESAISRKADEWTAEQIVMLRGMATALKEGRVTIDELFPKDEEQQEKTKTENNSAQQATIKAMIKDFNHIHKPENVIAYEAKEHNNIPTWPQEVQDAWVAKWNRTFDDSIYVLGEGPVARQNSDDPEFEKFQSQVTTFLDEGVPESDLAAILKHVRADKIEVVPPEKRGYVIDQLDLRLQKLK